MPGDHLDVFSSDRVTVRNPMCDAFTPPVGLECDSSSAEGTAGVSNGDRQPAERGEEEDTVSSSLALDSNRRRWCGKLLSRRDAMPDGTLRGLRTALRRGRGAMDLSSNLARR